MCEYVHVQYMYNNDLKGSQHLTITSLPTTRYTFVYNNCMRQALVPSPTCSLRYRKAIVHYSIVHVRYLLGVETALASILFLVISFALPLSFVYTSGFVLSLQTGLPACSARVSIS